MNFISIFIIISIFILLSIIIILGNLSVLNIYYIGNIVNIVAIIALSYRIHELSKINTIDVSGWIIIILGIFGVIYFNIIYPPS